MNIEQLSKLAQENLEQTISGEVSGTKGRSTTYSISKILAIELAKIKYQQHIGTVEKIPFFEGNSEEK